MLSCTSPDSWLQFLGSLSPAVAALLSATALWVAARARSTSEAAQSTSSDHEQLFGQLLERPVRNVSPPAVRARRRSSSRRTTST